MIKFMWMLVLALLSSVAFAQAVEMPEQVKLAIEGRKILESHNAGFTLKDNCVKQKSKKRVITVCKKVIDQFGVLLAVKYAGQPFKIIEADGRTCLSKTIGFKVFCYVDKNGKKNGANTEFGVSDPKGFQVFAIRRVIGSPPHGTLNSHESYKEVTYTPYSDFLNTVAVRQFGKAYLGKVLSGAYKDLVERKIRSLANKGAYVHVRVPREEIERLIAIEHIDQVRFAKEPMVDLVNEVYTIIAVNQDIAYNYAKSSAEARGLLQVIPSTYAGLKRVYPNAGLIPDFVKGMTNHHNAVKAAILLADHDVGVIPEVSTRAFLLDPKNRGKYRDYVSSAYNGGPVPAMSILVKGKDHVADNRIRENRIYVKKMREVAKLTSSQFAKN